MFSIFHLFLLYKTQKQRHQPSICYLPPPHSPIVIPHPYYQTSPPQNYLSLPLHHHHPNLFESLLLCRHTNFFLLPLTRHLFLPVVQIPSPSPTPHSHTTFLIPNFTAITLVDATIMPTSPKFVQHFSHPFYYNCSSTKVTTKSKHIFLFTISSISFFTP